MNQSKKKNQSRKTNQDLKIREPYQKIILNLTRNIDIASKQWSITGDARYAWQYERLKTELCELKEFIKDKERKLQDVPESFLNSN